MLNTVLETYKFETIFENVFHFYLVLSTNCVKGRNIKYLLSYNFDQLYSPVRNLIPTGNPSTNYISRPANLDKSA